MIMSAVQNGWLDEEKTIFEALMCFKRAGCDAIITYFAPFIAKKLPAVYFLNSLLFSDGKLSDKYIQYTYLDFL